MRTLGPFIQTFKKIHKMGKIKESFIKIKIFLACSSNKKNKQNEKLERKSTRERMENLEKPT
jgi:hypothetical protein